MSSLDFAQPWKQADRCIQRHYFVTANNKVLKNRIRETGSHTIGPAWYLHTVILQIRDIHTRYTHMKRHTEKLCTSGLRRPWLCNTGRHIPRAAEHWEQTRRLTHSIRCALLVWPRCWGFKLVMPWWLGPILLRLTGDPDRSNIGLIRQLKKTKWKHESALNCARFSLWMSRATFSNTNYRL